MEAKNSLGRIFKFVMLAAAAGLALAIAFALATQPAPALADETSSSAEASEQTPAKGGLPLMGNDYVWFGESLNLKNASVENDVIAAGRSIRLDNCNVFGDVRAAGQNIEIAGTYALQNITVAGESVSLSNNNANAVAAACNKFTFGGSCESLTVYANEVFINGTVEGDVIVEANSVTIGANAKIEGTLHVNAPHEPTMQQGAKVGGVDYTKTEEGTSTEDLSGALAGLVSSFSIAFAILGIIGTLLIAIVAEWLFRRHTAAAAEMIRTRTGATIGSGVVGALVAPIAIIILCCLVVTLPIAGALTLALLAMTVVASGFAGASLFKLAFPKLGRFQCALAGGAIMGVAGIVPILGTIVGAAAFMYFLGYVLQSIFLGARNEGPVAPMPTAQEPVAGAPVNTPVSPIPTEPIAQ